MVAPSFNDEAAKSRYGAQWAAQGSPKGRAHRPTQKSFFGLAPLALAPGAGPCRWPLGSHPPGEVQTSPWEVPGTRPPLPTSLARLSFTLAPRRDTT